MTQILKPQLSCFWTSCKMLKIYLGKPWSIWLVRSIMEVV